MENNNIIPGRYRHYKGKEYQVFGVAHHTESMEKMVIYRELTDNKEWWVQPLKRFLEEVEVNGVKRPRFEFEHKMP